VTTVDKVDSPAVAYRVLEHRATLATVAVLVALAGVAWWRTVVNADGMGSMVQGFSSAGSAMPFDMGAAVFLGMWTTMMVAMMFPTIAPIVLLHRLVTRRRGRGLSRTVAFATGYLTVWSLAGVVPLAVLIGFRRVAHDSTWVASAAGGVLVLAGLYQFTPWKQLCLRACRTPMTFLATHDFGTGLAGTFRAGLSHGLYCLGCCWALMAVLLVVGLMNLTWMAAIAIVFLAEKNWRHGARLTIVVGTAVTVLGIAVLAHPAFLDAVTDDPAPSAPMSGTEAPQ
jgi:predicted metal-binding membrane protein